MSEVRAPASKLEKNSANYRPMEKCSICIYFYPPNSCSEVEGNISPDAICNRYALKESSRPWNKEFYVSEYEKEGE